MTSWCLKFLDGAEWRSQHQGDKEVMRPLAHFPSAQAVACDSFVLGSPGDKEGSGQRCRGGFRKIAARVSV